MFRGRSLYTAIVQHRTKSTLGNSTTVSFIAARLQSPHGGKGEIQVVSSSEWQISPNPNQQRVWKT